MTKIIVTYLQKVLGSNALMVGMVSAIPIIEVRGAVPIAFAAGINPWQSFLLSLTGSMLIIPILLLFFRPILNALKRIKLVKRLALGLENLFAGKAQAVHTQSIKMAKGKEVDKHKLVALALFVAIPLPMTGVWSGCAIAVFLNLKFAPSFIVIALGNLCSALIMSLLCLLFIDYVDYILFAFLLLAFVAVAIVIVKSFANKAKKI